MGEAIEPASPSLYRTHDPTLDELLETFELASDTEVEAALAASERAHRHWRRRPLGERTALLERVARQLEERAEALARTLAVEMGKPLAEGVAEARKCAWVCRYYAEHAESFLRPRNVDLGEPADASGSASYGVGARVCFEPLGPLFGIMPWNFPLWQVFRFAAPALVAGNTVVTKHAPNTPRCARAIVELFAEADLPEGVFLNLFLDHHQAARVIGSREIRGVSFTGSTRAGREVAALAGRALVPTVMELGGSDAFVIFDDAELDRAVEQGVLSRCLNSGQSCIAAKRFLVQRGVVEDFLARFVPAVAGKTVGSPLDPATQIGPLARRDLRESLVDQVERALAAGAEVLGQGKVPAGPGFFHAPTVIGGLDPASPTAREELFGPVALVFPFDDEDGAVEIANGTDYGLGASLWTGSRRRVERLVPRLEAGSVFVNSFVASDPRLPFGGIKQSGFGRELAREGVLAFVNRKTVRITGGLA